MTQIHKLIWWPKYILITYEFVNFKKVHKQIFQKEYVYVNSTLKQFVLEF